MTGDWADLPKGLVQQLINDCKRLQMRGAEVTPKDSHTALYYSKSVTIPPSARRSFRHLDRKCEIIRNDLQEPPIKNPLKIKAASQTLGSREVSLETQKREGNAEWGNIWHPSGSNLKKCCS